MSFVFVLLVAALLGATLWWLQRQQKRGRAENIERSRELPPLSKEQLPDFTPIAKPPTAPPQSSAPGIVSETSADITTKAVPQPAAAIHWPDQIKLLKDSADLNAALTLCQQQFPKAQAFQQAAIVLRLQMKQQLDRHQDIAPLLAKLYRCAVMADLFRIGVVPKPANARAAMKQLATHEFDYQQIGHQQLKLLNKSDIRLLEQRWGKPVSHSHSEAVLGALWDNICR